MRKSDRGLSLTKTVFECPRKFANNPATDFRRHFWTFAEQLINSIIYCLMSVAHLVRCSFSQIEDSKKSARVSRTFEDSFR